MLAQVTAAAASFFTCWLAIVALRPIAIAVDLVDRPGGHKTHNGEVPVVGGLAMFMGIVLGVGLLPLPGASAGLSFSFAAFDRTNTIRIGHILADVGPNLARS